MILIDLWRMCIAWILILLYFVSPHSRKILQAEARKVTSFNNAWKQCSRRHAVKWFLSCRTTQSMKKVVQGQQFNFLLSILQCKNLKEICVTQYADNVWWLEKMCRPFNIDCAGNHALLTHTCTVIIIIEDTIRNVLYHHDSSRHLYDLYDHVIIPDHLYGSACDCCCCGVLAIHNYRRASIWSKQFISNNGTILNNINHWKF